MADSGQQACVNEVSVCYENVAEIIKSGVPLDSRTSIPMATRRSIHAAVEKMLRHINQLTGAVDCLREELRLTNGKNLELAGKLGAAQASSSKPAKPSPGPASASTSSAPRVATKATRATTPAVTTPAAPATFAKVAATPAAATPITANPATRATAAPAAATPAASTRAKNTPVNTNTSPAVAPAAARAKSFPVLVAGKSAAKSSDEVSKLLRKSVNPASQNIKVNGVRAVKTGVVVQCTTKADALKIKQSIIGSGADLKTVEISGLAPRVVIPGFDCDRAVEDLTSDVYMLNEHVNTTYKTLAAFASEFKVVHSFTSKKSGCRVLIAEVNAGLRKLLMSRKLSVGWLRVTVTDRLRIMQCFNCYKYGHQSRDCKSEKCCSLCAGPHSHKECKSTATCCIVCKRENASGRRKQPLDENHAAVSESCPVRLQKAARLASKIDYDGE